MSAYVIRWSPVNRAWFVMENLPLHLARVLRVFNDRADAEYYMVVRGLTHE